MKEMKIATIAQLMSAEASIKIGAGVKVNPEHVVNLPHESNLDCDQENPWPKEIYAARVEHLVCLAYVYANGKVTIKVH